MTQQATTSRHDQALMMAPSEPCVPVRVIVIGAAWLRKHNALTMGE